MSNAASVSPSHNENEIVRDLPDTPRRMPLMFAVLIGIGFLATFLWTGALAWAVFRLFEICL
jgi:hypothetical protein